MEMETPTVANTSVHILKHMRLAEELELFNVITLIYTQIIIKHFFYLQSITNYF